MKTLKIVGIVLAALLLIVLGGIAIVASQFDAARIKAEAAKVVQEKKQRTLKIDGDIKLSFWPNVGISLGKISLSEHQSDKEFAVIDTVRVSVAVMPLLSKQIVVNDIQLIGLKATIVKRKDGTLNIADLLAGDDKAAGATATPSTAGKSPADAGSAPLHIDIAGIKIANAALGWRDEQSGSSTTISGLDLSTGRVQADSASKTYNIAKLSLAMKGKNESRDGAEDFDIRLEAPQLSVTPEKSGGDSVTLSAVLAGPQRNVNVKLALSGVEGNASAVKIQKFILDLDAKVGEAAVKGRISAALAADIGKQTASLEQIDGSFDISHPQMPMKQLKLPLAGTLHADLARQSADGRLTTQFDESKIDLKFGVAKFSPLTLSFDLDVDKLNLDKYLPPKKVAAKADEMPAAKPAGQAAASDDKLDFSALKSLDLNGAVHVGQLQAHNVKVGSLRLQARAANGRLDVAPLSANLYEGTLNGALSLNANGNVITMKQNLAGISIAPLLKDAAGKDILDGRGSVALDLTAHGQTVVEMKKALAGSASLSLKDGAIKGINLAQSFRDLKSKFGARQDSVIQNKPADKTDFSELTASFMINSGVAHNDDLSMKSPFLRLAGNGDIDIGASRLDYLIKASVVATVGGQGAQDLEHLKGLTVPVRLSGPFDNPTWKIEFAGMANEAVKAKVEETKQKAQEKIKDKLKGLFGR
jgi:AsmA protein